MKEGDAFEGTTTDNAISKDECYGTVCIAIICRIDKLEIM